MKLQVSGNTISLVDNAVTVTGTWNPSVSDSKTKVIISGEVELNGKADCYSLTFEQGGHLTLNPGSRLRIWEGGITNDDCEDISYITIESSATQTDYFHLGELLLNPKITHNKQPKVSTKLYTYCKQISASPYNYTWQRFALPIEIAICPENNYNNQELFSGETVFKTYLYGWNHQTESWKSPGGFLGLEHNRMYQIANNTVNGGITYTYEGKILGNNSYSFETYLNRHNNLANSYLGKIDVYKIKQDLIARGFSLGKCTINIDNYNATYVEVDETYRYCQPLQQYTIQITSIPSGKQIYIDYETMVWDASFEDELPATRGVKGENSTPKSELPDDPIFKNPEPVEFENIK